MALLSSSANFRLLRNLGLCQCTNFFRRTKTSEAEKSTRSEKPQESSREWRSVFSYFYSDYNLAVNLNSYLNSFDFTPSGIRKSRLERQEAKLLASQFYIPERSQFLGPDLAAAHFVTHRNGRVKFHGKPDWIRYDNDSGDVKLPRVYQDGYAVEALDLSGTMLLYEGLENIKNLEKIEWLSIENCPRMDDWCLDRLCSYYSKSLQHLNVRGCPLITERGISSLYRFQNLKTLILGDHPKAHNLELVCLMLEEILPELKIEGIEYCNKSLLDTFK